MVIIFNDKIEHHPCYLLLWGFVCFLIEVYNYLNKKNKIWLRVVVNVVTGAVALLKGTVINHLLKLPLISNSHLTLAMLRKSTPVFLIWALKMVLLRLRPLLVILAVKTLRLTLGL